ncbi:hypothetical protein [Streptomyces sp. ISL-94]|nr:hypothetical protein [Streptomyces sp. ISL-94]
MSRRLISFAVIVSFVALLLCTLAIFTGLAALLFSAASAIR